MPTIRESTSGALPLFAVPYVDERGAPREATFHDRREAERFAADLAPVEPSQAAPSGAVRQANRAVLNRISGRAAPKDAPRTIQGVLARITGNMLTREG